MDGVWPNVLGYKARIRIYGNGDPLLLFGPSQIFCERATNQNREILADNERGAGGIGDHYCDHSGGVFINLLDERFWLWFSLTPFLIGVGASLDPTQIKIEPFAKMLEQNVRSIGRYV